LFVTNAFGIIFDCFEPDERQSLTGLQTSCISLGGIICSLTGGLLAGFFWYGDYLVLSVGVIIAIVAAINIPNYKTPKAADGGKRSPIRPKVFFYAVSAFVFMLCYVTVSQNISSHLAPYFANYSTIAGICSAVQMGGGVVSGLLFKKISGKLQDDTLVLALCILAAGLVALSFLTTALPLIFIAVFCCGLTLSLFTPWCIFGVSVDSDPTNSAVTSVIISAIAPSTGGFLSPVVFTNITNALVPGATDFRYRFVAACAFAVAVILFIRNRLAKDGAKA
ncbi:MAG: MFS transporter, partial [Oscillospiraceae bacterium]|nr:MFS transporter [Oscillospiraceae bacterium]